MSQPNITTFELAKCLSFLETAERAEKTMTAIELAGKLYLAGNRESQRRHVRALVEKLRKNGSMIVATLQDGYFLTKDPQLWRDYLEDKQIDAKKILGITHKRKRMLTEVGSRQGVLFGPLVTTGIG
jgi:biotin operon repressor